MPLGQPRASRLPQFLIAMTVFTVMCGGTNCDAQVPSLVEFFVSGKQKQGLALLEIPGEVVVLGQDGWLHSLDPRESQGLRHLDGKYQPISAPQLRSQLRSEFGKSFEVLATKNFLVVQPQGRGDRWPNLFESSHRSFVRYMKNRGVTIREGRFPMVAIVYPDQAAMYSAFRKEKIDISRVAGLYSNNSNRVMTHDGGNIQQIADTVRHEAAHQSAFNSGVHSRVTDTPKWISEGIGQMFEPAGMTANSSQDSRKRLSKESMYILFRDFPKRNDTNFSQAVFNLITADEMFADDKTVERAYATSWAMMFYLAEREPKAFARILNHTSKRPPFRPYSRTDRIRDFEKVVGLEVFEFSKRVNWFVHSLK